MEHNGKLINNKLNKFKNMKIDQHKTSKIMITRYSVAYDVDRNEIRPE